MVKKHLLSVSSKWQISLAVNTETSYQLLNIAGAKPYGSSENRKHTAQSVALATGATAKQISDWCTLGLIVGQREPLGKGRKREFSWFNVMEVAVATTIMEAMRMTQPGDAFRAAQNYRIPAMVEANGWAMMPFPRRPSYRSPGRASTTGLGTLSYVSSEIEALWLWSKTAIFLSLDWRYNLGTQTGPTPA